MANTIYDSFCEVVTARPQSAALMYPKGAEFVGITYRDLRNSVNSVAAALRQEGIGKGDAVAILSGNRPEWVMVDLAVLKLGGIVVPLYQNLPAGNVRQILSETEAKVAFVDTETRASLIESARGDTPHLQTVVCFDGSGSEEVGVEDFADWCRCGDRPLAQQPSPDADDLATIVYTSGTSGQPKGVMLTHRNLLSNATAAMRRFAVSPTDRFLSFLPLCHMFERTAGYYALLLAGGSIAYARRLNSIVEDARQVRPTMMIAVPRFLEKAYAAAEAKLAQGSALRRVLTRAAIRALNEHANRTFRHQGVPWTLRLRCAVFRSLIARRFRQTMGGRLRLLVIGGAPLDRPTAKVFHVLGFPVVEGYGMTEASPVVSCNTPGDNILGTVGRPLDGMEVKIDPRGEVLARGPSVMKGYWRRPQETAEAIDVNGWLHTGDQGRLDDDGCLTITGRLKELIVTSYGKNVAPAPIEARLTASPLIEQAVVYGDLHQHLIALIVPNREAVAQLPTDDDLCGQIRREIARATADLARYERPRAFALLAEPFTVDNGMLTPTLKLRRGAIAERYRSDIESLYKESAR